jgi:hypothetical protein
VRDKFFMNLLRVVEEHDDCIVIRWKAVFAARPRVQ